MIYISRDLSHNILYCLIIDMFMHIMDRSYWLLCTIAKPIPLGIPQLKEKNDEEKKTKERNKEKALHFCIHYMSISNSYFFGIMYFKGVQAGAVDRREHNFDADTEKVSNVERWGVAASSPTPVAFSSPSSYEGLYFMSAIPLFESLGCISLMMYWRYFIQLYWSPCLQVPLVYNEV